MASDKRNYWDPPDKPGANVITKKARYVNLCIYHLQDSTKDKAAVQADVQGASAIWCQANINIQAIRYAELKKPEVHADVISCGNFKNGLPSSIADLFNTRTGQGCDDIHKTIAVYYVSGASLMDGPSVSGCSYYECDDTGPHKYSIILTDKADARVLAHEIGHALLARGLYPNCTDDDPDPQHDPGDSIHNTNSNNLMKGGVAADTATELTAPQIRQTQASKLVQEDALVVGFATLKDDFRVEFLELKVLYTDDGVWNEDLETRWHFKVNGTNVNWDKDGMSKGKYALTGVGLEFDVSPGTGPISIEITGTEIDTFRDDILPKYTKEWTSADNWGAGSPNEPSVHLEPPLPQDPVSNSEDSIRYRIKYSILQRADEEIFRSVCEKV
jgi:hypothetical protein